MELRAVEILIFQRRAEKDVPVPAGGDRVGTEGGVVGVPDTGGVPDTRGASDTERADGGLTVVPDTGRVTPVGAEGGLVGVPDTRGASDTRGVSDTGRDTPVGTDGGLAGVPDTGRDTPVGADGGLAVVSDTGRVTSVGTDVGLAGVPDTRGVSDTGRETFPVARSPLPVTSMVSETGKATSAGTTGLSRPSGLSTVASRLTRPSNGFCRGSPIAAWKREMASWDGEGQALSPSWRARPTGSSRGVRPLASGTVRTCFMVSPRSSASGSIVKVRFPS